MAQVFVLNIMNDNKGRLSLIVCYCFIQGQVMFRNGERMGTIKFTQFQGKFTKRYTIKILTMSNIHAMCILVYGWNLYKDKFITSIKCIA